MMRSLSQRITPHWKRALSLLLVLLTVPGMLPATAFAAEDGGSVYAATGNFEVNVAGSTGWNGTRLPLLVYGSETDGAEIVSIPASDGGAPVRFAMKKEGNRFTITLKFHQTGLYFYYFSVHFLALPKFSHRWKFSVPIVSYFFLPHNPYSCAFRYLRIPICIAHATLFW